MTHLPNELLREMESAPLERIRQASLDDGLGLFVALANIFCALAIAGGCCLLGWMIYQVWRAM